MSEGGRTLGEWDEPWVRRANNLSARARVVVVRGLWARKMDLDEEVNLCEGQTWARGANLSDGRGRN